MADETLTEYSMGEVSKHNKQDDCWLIVGNMTNGENEAWDMYLRADVGGVVT